MVFSSLIFIFFFLPVTIVLYFLCPTKVKNVFLLIVSLIFYAWGEPIYIFLMIFSALTDYFHGLYIAKLRIKQKNKAKLLLFSSILINIAVLGFFKYVDFFITTLNVWFHLNLAPLDLPLPIGISFYTFQTMSYTIDVYRGKVLPQKNPLTFAMYVTLFPQLIAGPIVRYELIEEQLENRKTTFDQFANGAKLFIIGLGKKVLLANNIGLIWEHIQNDGISELTVAASWLGVIAFGLQIYFDFSGYSDMAIGLGKMFGFQFPQNFRYPYTSRSITEFWRRWHITLGNWFRDYVYIPLGGNKKGTSRLYVNLFIVWSLTGFWHGANWNFILWGLFFGIIIVFEKAFLQNVLEKIHPIFQHLYFLFFITISWVLFVFEDLTSIKQYYKVMFGFTYQPLMNDIFVYYLYSNALLLVIAIIGTLPIYPLVKQYVRSRLFIKTIIGPCLYFIILLLATSYLVDASFNPFLYFRF